jgi:cytochrome c5
MKKVILFTATLFLTITTLQNCKHEVPNPDNNNPNNTVTPVTKSDKCNLDTVYFVNDILPIILSNCAISGCHDANTALDGVILDSYDNIIKHGDIEAGEPDKSDLYELITETDPKKIMPPPPNELTTEQINAIRIWISQGAKNNECEDVCDTSASTFSGHVWPIFESTCTGCHKSGNAQGGVRLSNYAEIKANIDNGKVQGALSRTNPKTAMPPQGPLEECADALIRIWISEGAKNN